LAASLKKDDIIVEGTSDICFIWGLCSLIIVGYKEYQTGRTYMARMGDWRLNKDEEINLDGIGGVNIIVKADVHRSGECKIPHKIELALTFYRHQFPSLRI
jgi:hypothetical protein